MLKVGLTGGIGSGKTLISEIFIRLGIPVFNADQVSKLIVNTDDDIKTAFINFYGSGIYTSDGINRKMLADIIFTNQKELKRVNEIIHPKVRDYFNEWTKDFQDLPYVIEEAAILFESKAHLEMDFTINVHANELLRIERVTRRDNVSKELVRDRIKNQLQDAARIEMADFTIYNDNTQMVLPQVLEIHNKLLKV